MQEGSYSVVEVPENQRGWNMKHRCKGFALCGNALISVGHGKKSRVDTGDCELGGK